jgi:hypothetical protein
VPQQAITSELLAARAVGKFSPYPGLIIKFLCIAESKVIMGRYELKHKLHPKFESRSWIKEYPGFAYRALEGAEYHFQSMLRAFKRGVELRGGEFSAQWFKMNWHLRGLFWELVSVFDIAVRWSRESFQLKKTPDSKVSKSVLWTDLRVYQACVGREAEWELKREIIDAVWFSPWYFEIRSYRNSAHGVFLPQEVESELREKWVGDPNPDFETFRFSLYPIRDGQPMYDLSYQLKDYIDNMRKFGKAFFALH